jgi:CBS-domain-containing membrane protein
MIMHIEELMSRPVKTCSPADDLTMPARLMWEHDIGCIPVVDERGHAVGVVTDRDLCMAAYTQGRALSDIRVDAVMSRQMVACAPGDPLGHAEKLMKDYQVRRLPVIDAFGKLLGMISQNDLVREASREASVRRKDRELSEHEVVNTLAAIGAQRHLMIQTTL